MAGGMLGIGPEGGRFPAVFKLPIATLELRWQHARLELLPPSAPGKSIEVAHQQRLHLGVLDVAFYFSPVTFQIVVPQIITLKERCKLLCLSPVIAIARA
jgi:hypothetical protein